MKELDVLLRRYVDERFDDAPAGDQEAFWLLLECPDPTIYAYVMGTERPPTAGIAALVERIAAAP